MSSGRPGGRSGVTLDCVQDAVRAERLSLADLLESLRPEDWDVLSLCDAWTVRDVAAHLTTTTRETPWFVFKEALRARFSFDRMTRDVALRRAARFAPAEIIAQLRESAESSRRVVLSAPMDPLVDVVVHGQDIARPLGLPYHSPLDVVVASASYTAGNRLLGGPARVRDLRLVADDADWVHGSGPEVRGPAEDLLLAAAGRPAGLPGLTGDGLPALAARLG